MVGHIGAVAAPDGEAEGAAVAVGPGAVQLGVGSLLRHVGLGLAVDVRDGWLIVVAPIAGGPADRAGIQPGDRIVSVAGRTVNTWEQFLIAVGTKPDSWVSLWPSKLVTNVIIATPPFAGSRLRIESAVL